LPAIDNQNYNLIPEGALIFGLIFSGMTLLFSIFWLVWTVAKRNLYVVKVSQPVFLGQICAGAVVMVMVVVPLSMQEDLGMLQRQQQNAHGQSSPYNLDAACMSVPWLLFMGYTVSFSALFSKTWRLNRLLRSSEGMRRMELRPRDVLGPFLFLMMINVALLLVWTIVAPLKYRRVVVQDNVDAFGRSLDSYGTCRPGPDSVSLYFLISLAVVDLIGLCFAVYQLYIARNLPTEFQEASHLSIAMISFLETLLLGSPVLFIVSDSPSMSYVVSTAMVNILALCILVPTFVPKFRQRHMRPRGARAGPLNTRQNQTVQRDTTQEDQGLSSSYMHIIRR
jgi:gamma-aminobutyric acid type B receptor